MENLGPHIEDVWISLSHLNDVDQSLRALVSKNRRHLVHLGLVVPNNNKTDWSIISDNMTRLKSLKVTFKSDKRGSLEEFAKFKDLEFLVFAEDSQNELQSVLTDQAILPVLKGCKKLQSICLAGTKFTTLRLTNKTILNINSFCPNLKQLKFFRAHLIDNATLYDLARIRSLEVLHLSSMCYLLNTGIEYFAKNSPKCRNFLVHDCKSITDEIINYWIEAVKKRPNDKIKLYLKLDEGMSKVWTDLPSNLILKIDK